MNWLKKNSTFLLLVLLIVGGFFRFYNLNWGAPFYFHPDERNIASAVSQLQFPGQMNPHFFAYGSLPIYAIYFTGLLSNLFANCHLVQINCSVTFEQAILISRLFSATFSIFLISLLYLLGERLYGKAAGLLTALLATFSVGFLQFAHFGTFEMWLTLFTVLLFYILLLLHSQYSLRRLIFAGVILGILIAVKISSLIIIVFPALIILLHYFPLTKKFHPNHLIPSIRDGLVVFCICAIIYVVTNPYVILDTPAFRNSMQYETTLAVGTLPVFYTQEFLHTIPVLYHFRSVYPFLLNPFVTILFIPAFFFLSFRFFRKPKTDSALLLLFFLTLFLSQAVLYVKWTRYMVPTLPFVYLLLVGALMSLSKKVKYAVIALLGSITILYGLSYFFAVTMPIDTRVQAAEEVAKKLPSRSVILSEVYDLGIIPFNAMYPEITLFNFYDLEQGSPDANAEKLSLLLTETEYIILPSQRLYKTRLIHPQDFPKGAAFYSSLREENGYQKLYETPCSLWCQILYFGDPIFSYEGTASVFDRPTVLLYKKQ